MRAICDSCAQPQPRDWRPGDLCIHCGLAVREEIRCFWCVRWTPVARYCRKCGADVLEDPALYGAARMLKDAGADRFAIPKMLREFDADRIETFRAIYQSEAAIVAAHVSDLEFIQTFLHQQVWSSELEDQLLSQLPWPDGKALQLIRYTDGDRLKQIAKLTPVQLTANLVAVALYSRRDWEQQTEVLNLLHSDDSRIAEESALALTHWRALLEAGLTRQVHQNVEALLQQSRFTDEASVRLSALFPAKYPANRSLLASQDADIRFSAALNTTDLDPLRAVAKDEGAQQTARYAAFLRITDSGNLDPQTAASIATLDDEQIVRVLDGLSRKKQAHPLLTDVLLTLMRNNDDGRVRNRAATILSRDLSHETALAIFKIDPKDRDTASLLLRSNMPTETFAIIGARLIDTGLFAGSMYGMDNAAKAGRMPEGFVPANYVRAEEQREHLIRFAENQLGERACEPLQDFLIRKCFEEEGAAQHAAWSSMSRLVKCESYTAVCPFKLEVKAVNRIFRSMDEFLRLLTRCLRREEWRDDVIIFDPMSRFLRYPDDDVWLFVCGAGFVRDYIVAIIELIDCEDMRGSVRSDAFYPLNGIGAACPNLRPEIESELRRLAKETQFESVADYALRRIQQLTGLPEDKQ